MAIDVTATLRRAVHELESERARLDRQIGALRAALDGTRPAASTSARPRPRMSAAQRRAIGRRMKAYWAKRRAAKAMKKTSAGAARIQKAAGKGAARRKSTSKKATAKKPGAKATAGRTPPLQKDKAE